ncbi:MAG: tetratricopeptide repeat protein [Chloroflexota bacterium]|nr:tetratricopeptide repeat protein [Chloroflexota bacterium]
MAAARTRSRRPVPLSPSLQQLGERVRSARAAAGFTQTELGAPHFTRAYVSAIELGKIRPAMKSLEFIAAKLRKPVAFFLEDEGEQRERQERESKRARAMQLVAEGRSEEAVAILQPLLTDSRGADRASVLRALGRAYWEGGQGSKAVPPLEEALRFYLATNDAERVARTRAQLGMALHLIMSYAEAAEQLEIALAALVRGDLRDQLFKVHVLHNLGLTFFQRGDFLTALQHFERAAAEGIDIGDDKWTASLYAAMGMSRLELGDFEAAITYLRKSETLFESIRNRSRAAEIRLHTARTLHALGHNARAIETLNSARDAAVMARNPHLVTRVDINKGALLAEIGYVEEALDLLGNATVRADDLGELALRVQARYALGKVLKNVDPALAEQHLRQVVDLMSTSHGGRELDATYAELSEVLAKQGLTSEALEFATKAHRQGWRTS